MRIAHIPSPHFEGLHMYKLTVTDLHKRYGDHEVIKGISLKA